MEKKKKNYLPDPGRLYYAENPKEQSLIYCEIKPIIGNYSVADICFVCDITGSMDKYLRVIKESLGDFVKSILPIIKEYPRLSFIGFRDKNDKEQIVFKDFTQDTDDMLDFIKGIKCIGGGDVAEDLVTPLRKALEINWEADLRYVYLLLDAPPHGQRYYSEKYHGKIKFDQFPDDDKDMLIEKLAQHYRKSRINLVIFKCNKFVDITVETIKKYYESNINKLSVIDLSKIKLDDEKNEFMLEFQKNFLISLSKSFAETRSANFRKVKSKKEDPDPVDAVEGVFWKPFIGKIHTASIKGINCKEKVYTPELKVESTAEIECKISSAKIGIGTFATCHKLTVDKDEAYVGKIPNIKVDNIKALVPDLETNAFTSFFAKEFNSKMRSLLKSEETKKLKLTVIPLVIVENMSSSFLKNSKAILAQKFLEGDYIKYNNNYGFVNSNKSNICMVAQTFSHFTYDYSSGSMMVVDIQGAHSDEAGLLLTDPAIHSIVHKHKFGNTNHGKIGMLRFFKTHECNDYCTMLKLMDSNKLTIEELEEIKKEFPDKKFENLNGPLKETIIKMQKRIRDFDPSIEAKIAADEDEGDISESVRTDSSDEKRTTTSHIECESQA